MESGPHALIVTRDCTSAEKATGESGPPCLTPLLWLILTLVPPNWAFISAACRSEIQMRASHGCPCLPMCSVTKRPTPVWVAESNAFFTSILMM